MIDTIYKKKEVFISADIRSDKNLSYKSISFIKKRAIVLVILPTIVLMTNQVCLSSITFYFKL